MPLTTNQDVSDGDTIIVADQEDETEEVILSTDDEITETEEVIVDDGEGDADADIDEDASYTEHEYFFALDETDISTEEELDLSTLVPTYEEHELKKSVTLYGSDRAVIIGYTKPNITVTVMNKSDKWYCINFADESPEYQLVLVKAEEFIDTSENYDNMPAITAEDIKFALMPLLGRMDHGNADEDEVFYMPYDEITEEMDSVIEFTIPTYCIDVENWMSQVIEDTDLENYQLFYIEKVEEKSDDENSCFKINYGRLQKFAE